MRAWNKIPLITTFRVAKEGRAIAKLDLNTDSHLTLQLAQAQQEASVTREIFQLLVETIQDYAVFMISPEGIVQTWNKGAESIKGYTEQEILGKSFTMFYTQEDLERGKPQKLMEQARAEGRVEDEGWRVRKDGSWFWADVVLTALYNANHQVIGFSKVTRDLTQRKQVEEALRQSEERLRLIIDSIKDYAIFMLDKTGHVTTWNVGAEKLVGYTHSQIVGSHFSIFYPQEAKQLGYPDYELKMALEHGRFEDEGWRVRQDGSRFWANVIITPIHNSSGEHIGFAKVNRDLTERRQIEEKLKYLNQNLERLVEQRTEEVHSAKQEAEIANQRKSQFLANMSHELRTPLNAVIGYTEMTLNGHGGPLTEKQQLYLQRVSVSAHHLLGIINDLLDIAKIETGKLSIVPEPFDFESLITEVQEGIASLNNRNNVSVKFKVQPNIQRVTADCNRLRQILLNLISNAVKYNKPNGSVMVNVSQSSMEGERAVLHITVKDTGIGIPEDKIQNLFTPFYQVDTTLSREIEGVGLGLSITKHLIELHGGTILLESQVDVGTTVSFTIPVSIS